MTKKNKLISLSRKDWRRSESLPSILEDWYGKEEGSSEVIAHLPDTITIQDAIKEVFSGSNDSGNEILNKIRAEWSDLVGGDISSVSSPKFLKDYVLYVQVENSSWLMELRNGGKDILRKLQEIYGKDSIKRINFILSG